MIEIESVSLALQGARILDDVNLLIPKGGVTALVGPNGAGKSSLLSLIARLRPLQSGRIRVDGLPVDRTASRDLARVLAILRQDAAVSTRLRVSELVSFGRFPHSRGHLTAEDRRLVGAALALFDLTDLADRFVETLSGGQRQRALVAMAFCQDTDYLLLDEPLNNLDMFHARQLMLTLSKLAATQGRTVIVVLHDINHAAAHADHIVMMKSGRIAYVGTPGATIAEPALEDVFGYPMQVASIAGQRVVLHHR